MLHRQRIELSRPAIQTKSITQIGQALHPKLPEHVTCQRCLLQYRLLPLCLNGQHVLLTPVLL